MATDVRGMVSADGGLVDRQIFSDREIYEQELENIFAHCWLFLCHESQVAQPGDFFSTYMGEDPVLVTRDGVGKVHAFLNVCRHRGNRVCRADLGNASAFVCAYHGWTYGNDGKLIAVPSLKEAYYDELDTSKWGLVPVAQLDNYKGFYFATFDAEAPPLLDYLGEMVWYLDTFVDRREGGIEVVGGVHKWIIPCNWKFSAENSGADSYHVPWTHLSGVMSGFTRTPTAQKEAEGTMVSPGNGHGLLTIAPGRSAEPPMRAIDDYEQSIRDEVEARLGPRSKLVQPIVCTVFPNFAVARASARAFRVWHPRGPDKIEAWSWSYADKESPAEVKEALRVSGLRGTGPSGAFEQDDMDNWQECTLTSRGYMSKRIPVNNLMGLGHERFDEELMAGASDHRYSEINHRAFYNRWAELMEGGSRGTG